MWSSTDRRDFGPAVWSLPDFCPHLLHGDGTKCVLSSGHSDDCEAHVGVFKYTARVGSVVFQLMAVG